MNYDYIAQLLCDRIIIMFMSLIPTKTSLQQYCDSSMKGKTSFIVERMERMHQQRPHCPDEPDQQQSVDQSKKLVLIL